MKTLSLNGEWNLVSTNKSFNCTATIPGSDFGNLIKNGLIKNPLISGKAEEAIDTAKNDFTFSTSFFISQEMLDYCHLELHIDKIDTLCKIYINEMLVLKCNNAYIPIDLEIKDKTNLGENTIKLEFSSSVNYITQKQNEEHLPRNCNGINGVSYIRKAACHFGWDWGPCIPYNYVGNISISSYNDKISNIDIKQSTTVENSRVEVTALGMTKCSMFTPDGKIIENNNNTFVINKPDLWFTHDLSEKIKQPLYTIVLENSEMKIEKKIGLREIKLDTSKDDYGNNFCFVLNNKRVFAKGANLIPFSAIPEDADNSTVDYYLNLAIKSNFNMIRVWGGGDYASEYLMNRCDELGILIWQDLCFACNMYPLYKSEFVENVLNEIALNVKRLELHPSIALICGNNEIEVMFSYLPKTTTLVQSYIEFFYKTVPTMMNAISSLPYIPTSPIGTTPFSKNSSDDVGDTHMWNVWHGLKKLDYYQKRYTRFLSEFGLESLPSIKAINTFADKDSYSLTSNAFMSHQKCTGGNKKMMFYLTEKFDKPKLFEDLPYLTGIIQAECVKNASEHFRRNKGRCNGSLFWQFNDVWNAPSWSAVDFEKVPKALMYKARNFFDPVCVTYFKDALYFHNDTIFDKHVELNISIWKNDRIISKKTMTIDIKSDSVEIIDKIRLSNGEILLVDYLNKQFIFDNNAHLVNAKFSIKYDTNTITIISDHFAKNVCLINDNYIFEENYFDLLPNVPKVIKYSGKNQNIEIVCQNNIEYIYSPIKRKVSRLLYRLQPMNIANWFFYQFN